MRRQAAFSWVLGAVCWTAVAAASAWAVIAFTGRSASNVELGIDLVRTPAGSKADWQVRALPASAARLFFSAAKGPRADVEDAGGDESDESGAARVELASTTPDAAASALSSAPPRLAGIKSLAGPGSRAAEKACLAEVIYFQGRGQPVEAQIAVGQTVINRAISGVYPQTLCGVAHQHDQHDGQCQYSFACDSLGGVPKVQGDWSVAQDVAERLLSGQAWLPEIGDATHSHPLAEHPAWAKYLHRVKRIGALVFYRGDFAQGAAGSQSAAD